MFKKNKKTREKGIDIRKLMNNLAINMRKAARTRLIGRYKSVFRGTGLEFTGFREYTPEDDYSKIDWKASARSNKLLIKEYIEERKLNIFLLMDTSSTMIFGSTERLKCEYAADIATLLAYISITASDMVGFSFFNDKIVKFIKPTADKKQFNILLKELAEFKNYGGGFNLGSSMSYLFNLLEPRTVVIIISDFIGLKKDIENIVKLYSQKFDTIVFMVRDPRDESLACDLREIVLQDPFSNKTLLVDPNLINREYEEYVKKEEQKIIDLFSKNGIDIVKIETDKPFLPILIELFKKREMQKNRAVLV